MRFVLISLFATLAVAAPASAGQYTVYACKTPSDEIAPTDGWQAIDTGGSPGQDFNDCADAGSVGARVSGLAYITSGMAHGWSVDAPAGTRFSHVQLFRWAYSQNTSGQPAQPAAWVGLRSTKVEDAAWKCSALSRCFGTGVPTDLHGMYNQLDLDVPSALGTRVSMMVGCEGTGQCPTMTLPAYMVQSATQAATFTLTDAQAPSVASQPTGALVGSGDHLGTESASFPVTDAGSGVYRSRLDVRPAGATAWNTTTAIVDPNGGHCAQFDEDPSNDYEFGYLAPCAAAANVSVSLDTSKYADGDYQLRVRVEDAAGNETVAIPQTALTIHNAPVVTPGTTVINGSDPRTTSRLTAGEGTWQGNNIAYAYQWLRCIDEKPGTVCTPITGATLPDYTPGTSDLGRFVRVKVTGTNAAGSDSATSPPVGPVKNASGKVPQCADGIDNDDDGKIDDVDPGCRDRAGDDEASDRPLPTPTPTPAPTSTAVPASASPTPTPSATGRPTATPTQTSAPTADSGGDGHHDVTPSSTGAVGHPTLVLMGAARRTLGYGRRSSVTVSLRDGSGQPITGARLDVLERVSVRGAGFVSQGLHVTTDRDGTAVVSLRAAAGRTVRIAYTVAGGDGPADAVADVDVLVRSHTTLHKSRSFLHNGQTLHFSGRVQSRPVPARGVGIDLQAQVGKRWLTFKTLATDAAGRWHSSYRFRSTSGLQTYRFRARVRGDSGFPYLPSTSKSITVRVKG